MRLHWLVGLMIWRLLTEVASEGPCSVQRSQPYRWTTKCESRPGFTSKINITDIDVRQDDSSVTKSDGIDLTKPLQWVLRLGKYQTTLKDPYMDLVAYILMKGMKQSSCRWNPVVEPDEMNDLNPCVITDEDCTLKGSPSQIHMQIDLKEELGELLDQLPPFNFYAIETTIRDGKTPVYCFRIEHKIVKT